MIENILYADSVDTVRKINSVLNEEHSSDIDATEPEKVSENRDEYVPSEEKQPIGLYSVTPDENGEPRISFDRAEDKSSDNDNESEEETVTANTDEVDREIKSLRDKEQMLNQKLRYADESTAEDIRRELEQVTAELAQKDNDEYRRQHTVFT